MGPDVRRRPACCVLQELTRRPRLARSREELQSHASAASHRPEASVSSVRSRAPIPGEDHSEILTVWEFGGSEVEHTLSMPGG